MAPPEIISALTTPFDGSGEIRYDVFDENLARLAPFSDAVFVAGTTGEYLTLRTTEHADLVAQALAVFGADRVIVHVGAACTRDALVRTGSALELGARRFAAITPIYHGASAAGTARHFAALRAEIGSHPFYGYLFPDVAITDITPDHVQPLLDAGIDGLKLSGLASTRLQEYLAVLPTGFPVWSGNDADLPAVMAAGGTGTVSGVSGVHPYPWAAYRDAVAAGDAAAAERAQHTITTLVAAIGSSIAFHKAGLDRQGLYGGHCRMTIDAPTPAAIRAIDAALAIAGRTAPAVSTV